MKKKLLFVAIYLLTINFSLHSAQEEIDASPTAFIAQEALQYRYDRLSPEQKEVLEFLIDFMNVVHENSAEKIKASITEIRQKLNNDNAKNDNAHNDNAKFDNDRYFMQ